MSFEEAEILKERAEAFLMNSERLLSEGFFDLAAFNLEQYCQLILKYKLLLKTGTYPRTHLLTRLLRELSKIEPHVSSLLEKEESVVLLTGFSLEWLTFLRRYFHITRWSKDHEK